MLCFISRTGSLQDKINNSIMPGYPLLHICVAYLLYRRNRQLGCYRTNFFLFSACFAGCLLPDCLHQLPAARWYNSYKDQNILNYRQIQQGCCSDSRAAAVALRVSCCEAVSAKGLSIPPPNGRIQILPPLERLLDQQIPSVALIQMLLMGWLWLTAVGDLLLDYQKLIGGRCLVFLSYTGWTVQTQ